MEVVTKMKTANVIARVEPDVKIKAEAILKQLGIPVSVLIDSLYHQVIYRNGVPFPLIIPPSIRSVEDMTEEELHEMLKERSKNVDLEKCTPADEVFDSLLDEPNND